MVPTDCLMIQEPLVTRGMSLKVLLRRVWASLLSPPARNLPMRPSRSARQAVVTLGHCLGASAR